MTTPLQFDESKIEAVILEAMSKFGILTAASDVEDALAKAGYRLSFTEVYKRMVRLIREKQVKGA